MQLHQDILLCVSSAKMEEMKEALRSYPCWRELKTVHLGLITCILTMLQHLGGPADLGTVPPRVSQLPDHKQLAHEHMFAVQTKPPWFMPSPPHPAHTQARGPHPNHARPSQGPPHIPEPPPSNQSTLSWLRVLTLIVPPILRTPR